MRPVPGLMIEQQPGPLLWRLAVWSEARGEPFEGQLAVAWVIRNRLEAGFMGAQSLKDVVLKPWQFSAFNIHDPNRGKMLDADKLEPLAWGAVDAIVDLCERGYAPDPTQGATHYYRPDAVEPEWGRGHPGWQETAAIGHHVFGRAA